MDTTGSRLIHPNILRFVLVALVAAVVLGIQAVYFGGTAQAATFTVNSIGDAGDNDIGDGICETATPGQCTLRAAIEEANADGNHDTINFDSGVFSSGSPATIKIGATELPDITEDLTITAVGRGVILDGNDVADHGLRIVQGAAGVEFHLLGGGSTFIIREFLNFGIQFDANGFTTGPIEIRGSRIVEIGDAGANDDGINIIGAPNYGTITIDGNFIQADDDAIFITTDGSALVSNTVNITNNLDLSGDMDGNSDGDGVAVEFEGDMSATASHTLTINVNNNGDITGANAVDLEYCQDLGGCDAVNDTFNFNVNNNASITGSDEGVDIDVDADDGGALGTGSDNVDVNVNVNNAKGPIVGNGGDAVNVRVFVCCMTSDSTTTVNVDGNGNITGSSDGVQEETDVCCGNNNISNVNITDNGNITGSGDDGVDVSSEVDDGNNGRSNVTVSRNGHITGGDSDGVRVESLANDGNNNQSTVHVDDNDDITGNGGAEGVDIDSTAGSGDNNQSTVTVNGNGNIRADDPSNEGVDIDSTASGAPGDDSTSTVSVNNNGNITGNGNDAVEIDSDADGTDDNTSTVTVSGNGDLTVLGATGGDGLDADSQAGTATDGDNNTSTVTVTNNGVFTGDNDGIEAKTEAGEGTTGTNNDATITITGNDDIYGNSGDGVEARTDVCCDPANTNTVTISNNQDIASSADDAIDVQGNDEPWVCCSQNTITIQNNAGVISGNDRGIEVNVCAEIGTGFDADCFDDSETTLTISGNNVSNSGGQGIYICCGNFDAAGAARSQITNNTISNNGQSGIYIESASGILVGPSNTITLNGSGTGVTIVESDVDPGIDTDIREADSNTITRNSIFDNDDLGIDLDGDLINMTTTTCSDDGTDPNQCLKKPTLSLIQGTTLFGVGCGNCKIEVFVADNNPADQQTDSDFNPVNPHGEGKTFIVDTTANALGEWSVKLCNTPAGDVTATQTNTLGDTSEFGENLAFGGTTQGCATPTNTVGPTNTPVNTNTPGPTGTPTTTATVTVTPTGTIATPTETTEAPTATSTTVPPTATSTTVPPTATNTTVPPTATRTATRTATPPTKTCGDVNGNGSVNSVDAALVLQFEAGLITTINMFAADVNDDGVVNSVDAALILQREAGLIPQSALDCGSPAGSSGGADLQGVLGRVW